MLWAFSQMGQTCHTERANGPKGGGLWSSGGAKPTSVVVRSVQLGQRRRPVEFRGCETLRFGYTERASGPTAKACGVQGRETFKYGHTELAGCHVW